MSILDKTKKVFKNPYFIIPYLGNKGLFNWLPDKPYLKACFRARMHQNIDFNKPKTFNEKLQWLKLYDRNPSYTQMVDKYEVRQYIAKTIGEDFLIPFLGVYDRFDEIDFNDLPNQFVLKCTHDSGGIVICKNKSELKIDDARKKITKSLKRNYYYNFREWPYKRVKPRIICEEYMVDESGKELKDYKIFCFNGEPKLIQVDFDRFTNHKRNLYDTKWNYIDASIQYPSDPKVRIKKPEKLEKMLNLAMKLSKKIPHVRVDFYYIRGEIYFGELTFYHEAGLGVIKPKEFDEIMGEWLKLPIV